MSYIPSKKILEKYADLLVRFALGGGVGIAEGEVVWMCVDEPAKPLYVPLRNAILQAGGIPLINFIASDVSVADEYELASDKQLSFFMERYYRGLVDQVDHMVYILAESDKYALKTVEPRKILLRDNAKLPYVQWRNEKEAAGKFTWTIAMYGTEHMAHDVGMELEEYWQEIIKACYLDSEDPIAEWKKISAEIDRIKANLNALSIQKLHVEAEGIDLWIGIGPHRQWLGGGGRNIPSFELFISPDWRLTEGKIAFNQPLFRYGNRISDIKLEFKDGVVVSASAGEGDDVLQEMIASPNAHKIGEFSLTDSRFSRITKVMGETLYDENMGGEQGNTHVALGSAYQDSYPGDASSISKKQWEEWGYNDSPVHTDIVSTTKRTVTAYLDDGSQKIIYTDGRFTI